ncbi:MAG: 3-methyl-2-oxobutanoate hydroxymethyltransferase [Gammaproteobacteria bacterium]|nr:3-methyl-2-oxobutanoate hydroxymethyltransferase [Gammaproteobacteria bacterium]MBU1655612.1 3-methyl-2-oxobutanoate hydroxymethyltransferase [Gammaproteobacteria bacterium]MBU1962284.1 3-methyl-2-oxobutanoate hydroxymethyltransferase [Gammaproteobacteria bacterium]
MKNVTISTLARMKRDGEKIAMLTCYDAGFVPALEQAGVDVLLVGDSLGMVVQGHSSTLPVTLDHMVYHTACVARARGRAFLIADMPFMSYAEPGQALATAARLMKEGGAHMVKLEGGESQLHTVKSLSGQGVPVCAHLGLQPQSVHRLGGYRVQGADGDSAEAMRKDALALQAAGAQMLVLECVPAELAREISGRLCIPVIGIGAGRDCDGQVLVLYDVLGLTPRMPRFAKDFLKGRGSIAEAAAAYVNDVRRGAFPEAEQVLR